MRAEARHRDVPVDQGHQGRADDDGTTGITDEHTDLGERPRRGIEDIPVDQSAGLPGRAALFAGDRGELGGQADLGDRGRPDPADRYHLVRVEADHGVVELLVDVVDGADRTRFRIRFGGYAGPWLVAVARGEADH